MFVTDAGMQPPHRRDTSTNPCVGTKYGRRTCIPTEARRRGRILLNQQLWLFGQDIRRPEGNALIEYGFWRTRPPEGERGSNTYCFAPTPDTVITLWAFGFYYRRVGHGGIFISRFGFTPRLAPDDTPPGTVWSALQLAHCRAPHGAAQWARAQTLFIPALRWIVDYERWIAGARGLAYRHTCVESWPKARIPAAGLADEWARLADECDAAMRTFIAIR